MPTDHGAEPSLRSSVCSVSETGRSLHIQLRTSWGPSRCRRIRTLISYQLSSENLSSGQFQKAYGPRAGILRPGSLSVAFKADSSQVPAILHFPGSYPFLLGSKNSREPLACLRWPEGEFIGHWRTLTRITSAVRRCGEGCSASPDSPGSGHHGDSAASLPSTSLSIPHQPPSLHPTPDDIYM